MTAHLNSTNNSPPLRQTREAWLEAAIDTFRPRFVEIGYPLPDRIHISIGFGYGAKRENSTILGQCWKRAASADDVNHIFVGPEEADTMEILVTVLHELIHAALDCADGHRGRFAEAATRLGFTGPMTLTPPSVELAAELVCIAEALGEFPHGALNVKILTQAPAPAPVGPDGTPVPVKPAKWHSGPVTQGTRMIRCVCPYCNYQVRTTKKWLAIGAPKCPLGNDMVADL